MSDMVKVIEGAKIPLSEEQKADVFCIKANLADKVYIKSFVGE